MSNFFAKNRSMRGYDWWSESPSQKVRLDNGLSLCTGRGSHPILFVVVLPEARSFVTFLSDIQSMSVSASLSGYECSDVTSRFESRSEFRLHQQKSCQKVRRYQRRSTLGICFCMAFRIRDFHHVLLPPKIGRIIRDDSSGNGEHEA